MARKPAEPKVKIGDRFGKLTVIERSDIEIVSRGEGNGRTVPTGRMKIGWHCVCDCGRDTIISEATLLKQISTVRSCGKCPQEINTNYVSNSMTAEEVREWNELYDYVRKNIFGYDSSQSLPSSIVTRLKGLLFGKYKINNKTANKANYSYKVVLNTFKYCSSDIQRALKTNNFRDEQHKFNYIAKIIENNINDVYIRMKNAEKAKEAAREMANSADTYNIVNDYVDTFKSKEKKKRNSRLDELW